MEKVFAIMLIKNEEDIIEYTISHLFSQGIDGIIVRDNGSYDHTWPILQRLAQHYGGDKLVLERDFTHAFYQAKKLNDLAAIAATQYGATWVMVVDADELFYTMNPSRNLAEQLSSMGESVEVVGCAMWNHYCTPGDAHTDPNPYRRMIYRYTEQNPLDKCIIRYKDDLRIDEGNHRILRNGNAVPGTSAEIGIRHFSARSCNQFVTKSIANARALEAARGISYDIGAHCRRYKEIYDSKGPKALDHVFYTFFYYDLPSDKVALDPAPYSGDL